MAARSRTPKPPRSLTVLLQSLVSQTVTVETRSGTTISGVLEAVDQRMNLTLRDASAKNRAFPSVYLSGRHVVFVYLPDDVDIHRSVDEHIAKVWSRRAH